jgi:hypothetical protein
VDALELAGARDRGPSHADAVEIANLMQAYALYTDAGRRDEMAALFTDEATWDGVELGYGAAAGPAAIVDAVLAHFDPARPMVHLPGPPLLVQTSEDEVEAFSWCLATRLADGATKPLIYFSYEDILRRTATGWRFVARTLRLRFRAG